MKIREILKGALRNNSNSKSRLFALVLFALVFLFPGEASALSSYWKNYFSIEERKAVQKNAEKYTISQIESKSKKWKGIIRGYNIKNGSISDDDIEENGITTNKIRGLGDYVNEKISDSSTSQDFSANNLTGTYAALNGSQITNLNPTNITGSGNLNIGNGDLFVDDTSGNVGIGTTSPGARLGVVGAAKFKGTTSSIGNRDYIWFDSNEKISTQFDNNGRTDKFNYSGVGSVHVLYNASSVQTDGETAGHYAYGILDDNGYFQTTGGLWNVVDDVTPSSISSRLSFGYMDSVNASSGPSFQPNKYLDISANGLVLPGIPFSGATTGNFGRSQVADGNITSLASGTAVGAGSALLWTMNVGGGNAGSILGQIKPSAYQDGVNVLNFYVGAWNNAASAGNPLMSIRSNGNVGIGTTSPQAFLHVVGDNTRSAITATRSVSGTAFTTGYLNIELVNNDATTNNWSNFGFTDAVGVTPSATVSAQYIDRTNHYGNLSFATRDTDGMVQRLFVKSSGNVGIGTIDPKTKLEVDGIIKTKERATATCNADAKGGIYFDSDDNHFYGCNGTAWVQLDN